MKKKFGDGSLSLIFIWFAVVIFFAVCIIFPLFCVAITPRASDFVQAATSSRWHDAMRNTALECLCSTLLSVITGYIYAYAVVRGGIPFKKIFSLVPIIHLVTPPFVGGLAFILLIGRQGFITHTLLGLDISLYGFPGLLIAQTLTFFPMAYLICAQSLRGINPSMEQAARGMGAGRLNIFFKITLPLSSPGILSALLFIAVSVLSDFGNPLIVAGRFRVLAVEIYTQLTGWLNAGTSAILGMILLIPSIILFILQNKTLTKEKAKVATIGGKTQMQIPVQPSKCAKVLLTIFCAVISLAVIAQFAAIIAGSIQKVWGVNTAPTFDHIKKIGRWIPELRNTIFYALLGAALSTTLATVTAYLSQRTTVPLKPLLDAAAQIPAAIPGSLFGLALSLAANKLSVRVPPLLIAISMGVMFMPFCYRVVSTGFSHIKPTLDDGAASLGANRRQTLATIILPLSASSIFSAFIYAFVRGVGTVSAVIFLVSFNTHLSSITILNLAEQGDWGQAASLALTLTILTFAVLGAGYAATQSIAKKHGGQNAN
ncbi:MAG: iron ABC transporter permease [Treponema sp.]|nr:iron ABC transporter permease [Treponema sp.]